MNFLRVALGMLSIALLTEVLRREWKALTTAPPFSEPRAPRAFRVRPRARVKYIERVTLAIIAVGLLLTAYQSYELRRSVEISNTGAFVSVWTSVSGQTMEMNKMIVERHNLSAYFLEGKDLDLTDSDARKIFTETRAMAITLLDHLESLLAFLRISEGRMEGAVMNIDAYERYLASSFRRSPVLCRTLHDFREGYAEDFVVEGERICTASGHTLRAPSLGATTGG